MLLHGSADTPNHKKCSASTGLPTLVSCCWPRVHEAYTEERVCEVLYGIKLLGGYVRPVFIDRFSGVVLDGHHRLEAARRLKLTYVPAVLVDYEQCENISVSLWPPPESDADDTSNNINITEGSDAKTPSTFEECVRDPTTKPKIHTDNSRPQLSTFPSVADGKFKAPLLCDTTPCGAAAHRGRRDDACFELPDHQFCQSEIQSFEASATINDNPKNQPLIFPLSTSSCDISQVSPIKSSFKSYDSCNSPLLRNLAAAQRILNSPTPLTPLAHPSDSAIRDELESASKIKPLSGPRRSEPDLSIRANRKTSGSHGEQAFDDKVQSATTPVSYNNRFSYFCVFPSAPHDYKRSNLITPRPSTISKRSVIECGLSEYVFPPKTTRHHIRTSPDLRMSHPAEASSWEATDNLLATAAILGASYCTTETARYSFVPLSVLVGSTT